MKELKVTYLFSFLFFLASFSNIFVFVLPIKIKMRGVYVGGNERKRDWRECFLLFFFFTSFNMNMFF